MDFKREFEMEDLSPSSHYLLSQKFLVNESLAQKFNQLKYQQDNMNDTTTQKLAYCETFSSQIDQ